MSRRGFVRTPIPRGALDQAFRGARAAVFNGAMWCQLRSWISGSFCGGGSAKQHSWALVAGSGVLDLMGPWINEVNYVNYVTGSPIPEALVCLSYEAIKSCFEAEIFIW